jgi:hypothetical protein
MTADEGSALVRSLLPGADGEEATSLAASLGFRPLVIMQACAYLKNPAAPTPAQFLSILARDIEVALLATNGRSDAALTVTYREMLDTLRQGYPAISFKVLVLLTFAPPLFIPREVIVGFIARQLPIEESERLFYEHSYASAVAPLRELSLIEERELGIRLNSLTQELLRNLVLQDAPEVLEQYDEATDDVDEQELFELGWSPGEIASMNVIGELFYRRGMATAEAKEPPSKDKRVVFRFLTADEWGALTEALWERQLRVAALEYMRHFPDETSPDNFPEWSYTLAEQADQIAANIPGREDWERRTTFDWLDFWDWLLRDLGQSKEARDTVVARVRQDFAGEIARLTEVYALARTVWAYSMDPIVETRLGRVDLRDLFRNPNDQEEPHAQYRLSNPRVVLGLEGECELRHAELTLQALRYSDASDLLRLAKIRCTDLEGKLTIWMTTIPRVDKDSHHGNSWRLKKPLHL